MYIPRYNGEEKIIIFTGAGCDVPSGLAPFRGKNSIWEKNDINIVCNDYTWKKNYEKVHNFYNELRNQIKDSKCNEYHYLIKDIYDKHKEKLINITTNISDFFDRLKIPTMYVHGKITEMECTACGNKFEIGYANWNIENERCPKCGSHKGVKPNIVFFNGYAWLYSYMKRAFEYLQNPNSKLIVIGSSSNVVDIDDVAKNSKGETFLLDLNKRNVYDNFSNNIEDFQLLLKNKGIL